MSAIAELLRAPGPYAARTAEDDARFAAAMAEADAHHRARNPTYAALWGDDDARPCVPVGLFKRVDLATPVDDDGVWLGSSGTTSGQATRVYFDRTSMGRIQQGMLQIFLHHRVFDLRPSLFLVLAPDPTTGDHPGYATTFTKFTACAPVRERVYAVDPQGRLDVERARDALTRWGELDAPIFLFGLTVYFEQLCLALDRPLPQRHPVRGVTGGGWKGLARTLDRPAIVERLGALLPGGVDVRDLFGLTEHPLHYVSCPAARFHLPSYARASIIGVDGAPAPLGVEGAIRLESPLFASLPSHDLLTEDRGRLDAACPCGAPTPALTYLDRLSAPTGTCAATAVTA